jgi:hypothetical protein
LVPFYVRVDGWRCAPLLLTDAPQLLPAADEIDRRSSPQCRPEAKAHDDEPPSIPTCAASSVCRRQKPQKRRCDRPGLVRTKATGSRRPKLTIGTAANSAGDSRFCFLPTLMRAVLSACADHRRATSTRVRPSFDADIEVARLGHDGPRALSAASARRPRRDDEHFCSSKDRPSVRVAGRVAAGIYPVMPPLPRVMSAAVAVWPSHSNQSRQPNRPL